MNIKNKLEILLFWIIRILSLLLLAIAVYLWIKHDL
jgi:hypothetical protein